MVRERFAQPGIRNDHPAEKPNQRAPTDQHVHRADGERIIHHGIGQQPQHDDHDNQGHQQLDQARSGHLGLVGPQHNRGPHLSGHQRRQEAKQAGHNDSEEHAAEHGLRIQPPLQR